MPIELTTKFLPYVDEIFSTESKISLITNQAFSFTGANVVKIYKISTAPMNDYRRSPTSEQLMESRFGIPQGLEATTQSFILSKDRSFTFAIDKLDEDETAQQLSAATALSRQLREVVVPEVDKYTYNAMCSYAGTKADAITLTPENIYDELLKASQILDDAEVPETERVLTVSPAVYSIMKKSSDIAMDTDVGNEMRVKGVIATLDGNKVIKIPAVRLPVNFGFLLSHPSATVAPTKLADYRVHQDPPGISGALVEGRVVYDAFVLENKAKAIYYQPQSVI